MSKLTTVPMEALKALATQNRPYPQKDRTMRRLLSLGMAEYIGHSKMWAITPAGRAALANGDEG